MSEEISIKDFQKLKEQILKLDNKSIDQLKKFEQKTDDRINGLDIYNPFNHK